MSGEIGAEEETYSLKLLLNCTLTETDGGTDMLLMALVPSQAYCTPATRTTMRIFWNLENPLLDLIFAS